MEPTAIVDVIEIKGATPYNVTYEWVGDNKRRYSTVEMAEIIGTTRENLLVKWKKHGLNNEKLFVKSRSYFKPKSSSILFRNKPSKPKSRWCCNVGDRVMVLDGIEAEVLEEISSGSASMKEKSSITVGRIDRTGAILKRSPIYVGDKWKHIKGEVK